MSSAQQANIPYSGTLSGKVAIVTGSAQGIGRTLAEQFGAAGATTVIADLDVTSARRVADDLKACGMPSLAVQVDVANAASVENLVAAAIGEFGRIDVLVNNAAIFSTIEMRPFDEIPSDEWNRVIDVNLTGVFNCCRAVAETMRRQGTGRIINMSSATVLFGRPNYLHYVASKAGVLGITRGLARELGPFGVTVNSILPGSIETGIPRGSVSGDQASRIIASQSIGRRLTSKDIVGITLFLASDDSEAITGQSLVADGGANFL